jgi:predicted Zn-dependent protease with MMP-like domain
MAYSVSKTRFGELVQQALDEVPPDLERYLEEITIEIRDLPAREELRGVGGNGILLGLYRGRPRTQRSVEEEMVLPDVILIFQKNIEAVCASEMELVHQVRTTVLHEIGHHFGMSEKDLDELGYG